MDSEIKSRIGPKMEKKKKKKQHISENKRTGKISKLLQYFQIIVIIKGAMYLLS